MPSVELHLRSQREGELGDGREAQVGGLRQGPAEAGENGGAGQPRPLRLFGKRAANCSRLPDVVAVVEHEEKSWWMR